MDGVVAVHGPVAAKIAEAEEKLNLFAELQATHVFPRMFYACRRDAIPRQDPELFHMDVDGMLPAMGVVSQYPPFRSVSLTRETDRSLGGAAVCILSVDLPLAIPPLEFEGASNARWHID
jgi:hypothetical protein